MFLPLIFTRFDIYRRETQILGRMRTPVREAFSYGIRHVIRHVHCDSINYDQIRVKPYPVSYRVYRGVAKIWRMILGRMHTLKCKKSVVNDFKNPIEAMVKKEKCLPQITLSLFD